MQSLLDQLFIELVLTAHPTEARRRTVTSKIQRVAHLLGEISEERYTPSERGRPVPPFMPRLPASGSPTVTAPSSLLSRMRCAPDCILWKMSSGMQCQLFTKISSVRLLFTTRMWTPIRRGYVSPPGWAATAMETLM